jgi:hypothetical protein
LPLPTQGTRDYDNGELAFRVTSFDQDSVYLQIGTELPDVAPVVDLRITREEPGARTTSAYGLVRLVASGATCSGGTFDTLLVHQPYVIEVEADTAGFQQPELSFSVNGVEIGGWHTLSEPVLSAEVEVPAEVDVPNGYQSTQREHRDVTVRTNTHGNRLGLTFTDVPIYDGAYPVTVTVQAREGDLGEVVAEASVATQVVTCAVVLSPEGLAAGNQCGQYLSHWVAVPTGVIHNPGDPIELGHVDWGVLTGGGLAAALLSLAALHAVDAAAAEAIAGDAAVHLQMDPSQVLGLSVQVGKAPRTG